MTRVFKFATVFILFFAVALSATGSGPAKPSYKGKVYIGIHVWPIRAIEGGTSSEFRVVGIFKGSAGERSGLKRGDIITSIDGKTFQNKRELITYITSNEINSTINVKLWRSGKAKKVPVLLDRYVEFKRPAKANGWKSLSAEFRDEKGNLKASSKNPFGYKRYSSTFSGVRSSKTELDKSFADQLKEMLGSAGGTKNTSRQPDKKSSVAAPSLNDALSSLGLKDLVQPEPTEKNPADKSQYIIKVEPDAIKKEAKGKAKSATSGSVKKVRELLDALKARLALAKLDESKSTPALDENIEISLPAENQGATAVNQEVPDIWLPLGLLFSFLAFVLYTLQKD